MLSCVFLRTQVDLDHRFIDHGGINLLDLSDQDKTPTMVINEEQTNGADWLLLNDTDSAVCNSFPTPYDNDYRGERQEIYLIMAILFMAHLFINFAPLSTN